MIKHKTRNKDCFTVFRSGIFLSASAHWPLVSKGQGVTDETYFEKVCTQRVSREKDLAIFVTSQESIVSISVMNMNLLNTIKDRAKTKNEEH